MSLALPASPVRAASPGDPSTPDAGASAAADGVLEGARGRGAAGATGGSAFPSRRAVAVRHPAASPCAPARPSVRRLAALDAAGDLVLEDGSRLRLAGLAVPDTEPGHARAAWRAELEPLVGSSLGVVETAPPDRYGRRPALVTTVAGASLNQRLVSEGLAVMRPEPGPAGELGACLAALLAAETAPRRERRGVWAWLPLPAHDPAALAGRIGTFTILEGRVLSVGTGRSVDYLNFGRVWRKDTTIRLEKGGRDAFMAEGIAPEALAGQRVLARGVLHEAGGPALTVEGPGQLLRVGATGWKQAGEQ